MPPGGQRKESFWGKLYDIVPYDLQPLAERPSKQLFAVAKFCSSRDEYYMHVTTAKAMTTGRSKDLCYTSFDHDVPLMVHRPSSSAYVENL